MTTDGNHSILASTNCGLNLTNAGPGLTNAAFTMGLLWNPATLTNSYIAAGQFGDANHFWQLIEGGSATPAIRLIIGTGIAPVSADLSNVIATISPGNPIMLWIFYDGSGGWSVYRNNDTNALIAIAAQSGTTINPVGGTNVLSAANAGTATNLSAAGNYQDLLLFNSILSYANRNAIFTATGISYTPVVYSLPTVTWTQQSDYQGSGGAVDPLAAPGPFFSSGLSDPAGYVWSQDTLSRLRAAQLTSNVQNLGLLERIGASDLMIDNKQTVRFTCVAGDDIFLLSRLTRNVGNTLSTGYMAGYLTSAGSVGFYTVLSGVVSGYISGQAYPVSPALTYGTQYDLTFWTQQYNSGITVLQLTISDTSGTVLFTQLLPDATSTLQNATGGQGYFFISNTVAGFPAQGAINRITTFRDTSAGTLTRGKANCTNNPATVTVNITPPTGGTAPYTYAIYRGTTISSSISGYTLVHSGTELTYADTPPGAGLYYYIVVATDSASASVQYIECPGQVSATYLLCGIGDSRTIGLTATLGNDPLTQTARMMEASLHPAIVYINNQGLSGFTSAQWASGTSTLNNALASFKAQALTMPATTKVFVQIMLGANDSLIALRVTPSQFATNIQSTINAITAYGIPGLAGIVLHYSYYGMPYRFPTGNTYDETSDSLIQQYNAQLLALANGSSVFVGDTKAYEMFAANAANLLDVSDGIHPLDSGYSAQAGLWEKSYLQILGKGGGGGGGGASGPTPFFPGATHF